MIGFEEATPDQLVVNHSLEVSAFTGTARLDVPLRVTPGRDGFTPTLGLGYASGQRNSTFGLGWFLTGIPSIGRDTRRGLPTYREGIDRFVVAGGEELVPYRRRQGAAWAPVTEQRGEFRVQRFRLKVERSFERFELWTDTAGGRAHWRVYGRDGVVSVFGQAADGSTCIADPADPDRRIFQWLLERQYDPKGNAIDYGYKPEDGAGVDPGLSFEAVRLRRGNALTQRYLKRIRYGNSAPLSTTRPDAPAAEWRFEVVFDYGEHNNVALPTPSDAGRQWTVRADPFSTHLPGFEVRTWRLCRRVLMFHRFPELGAAPRLVGATELTQRDDPGGTVLERVGWRGYRTEIATGGTTDRALPSLVLTYSPVETSTAFELAEPADNIPNGLDGARYQWMDLRNEGLPGVLSSFGGGWYFKENLGDGRFGPMQAVDEVPAAVSVSLQLQDFDGDGNLDLVGFEGREAGYYEHDRERGSWNGYRTFDGLPRVDFRNARVQWVDLNGDGHADLLVEYHDRLAWYASEGTSGFAPPVDLARPDTRAGGAPTCIQNAQLHTFFADMNGDGLLDLVRVENGRVEYWPNEGWGTFGAGVVMEDAPTVEAFGELDSSRLRFVDLDDSGCADLVYIGLGEVRYWTNQGGNRFAPERRLTNLPYIDRLASAQVFDFLGDGTRCLVWSTSLPAHEGQAIQYLRLTGPLPPRLLTAVANGAGQETRIAYRSSARDYLRDKREGRPWGSLLPRHTLVVDQIEGVDHVGGGRLVTRYAYRDGHFDDEERRFVGFGQVDTTDADLVGGAVGMSPEEVALPSLVRTWYHTGATNHFAERSADFHRADPLAVRLPDPVIEEIGDLTTDEQIDAYRTLAGVQWRQEVYSVGPDGVRAPHPLRTNEFAYRIDNLQPATGDRDAVFTFVQSESLSHEYEADPSDPRVTHDVLIENDAYGDVTQRASVAYPRRPVGAAVRPEQQALFAEYVAVHHLNVDTTDRFEVGIEVEHSRHALTGIAPIGGVFDRDELIAAVASALADPLAFHEQPGLTPQARLIAWNRNRFWDDVRGGPLPVGQVGAVTLLHHVERAVLPEAAIDAVFGGRVPDPMLSGEGFYTRDEGHWWAEDTTYHYRGAASFHRLEQETTPGGSRQIHTFDPHFLMVTEIEDVLGNRVASVPDYQVMAATQVRDANDNVSEARYDPLGIVEVVSLRGQQLGDDGAAHPVGAEDLAGWARPAIAGVMDVLADPAACLQDASRFVYHDVAAFERDSDPVASILLERERHVHDGEGAAPSDGPIVVRVLYRDGFGRTVQATTRADPGPAIQRDANGDVIVDGDGIPVLAHADERWLTAGHDVYNNKGWLARRYEPFFSTSPAFELDQALFRYGVATRNRYDPIGRLVREDDPNGTLTTSTYTAWETRRSDANDNVLGSRYEAERLALHAADPQRDALAKAQAHAQTPTTVERDVLGRPVRVVETGSGGVSRVSTTTYTASGLPARVVDPRGVTAFTYGYDMLDRTVAEHSADAGNRWTLFDAHGRAIHRWDGRDLHTALRYDQNGRLTEARVDGALGMNHVVERLTYGDDPAVAQAGLRNARGRLVEYRDAAGVLRVDRYNMDGQPIDTRRTLIRLPDAYLATADWSNPAAVPLEHVAHRTRIRLDALGRLVSQTLPDGTTRDYDHAALGHISEVRLTTADGQLARQVVVTGIEANARAQRTRVRYGNDVESSWEYDPYTFRLERHHTRRATGTARDYLDIEYTYDPVGNVTRWVDRVQDPGSATPLIHGLTVSSVCGFTYDAFYQLTAATGRVHQALLEHDYRGNLPDPGQIKGTRHLTLNNGAAVERYTRRYDYDLSGNVQRFRHQGATQSWTTDIWTSPTSNRSLPRRDLNGVDTADPEAWFDENGNTTRLPHLRAMDWNHANRLARAVIIDRSATGEPDDAEYYVYGADGLRIRRVTERLVAGQVEVATTTYFDGCEIRRITRGAATRLLRQTSHVTDGERRVATLHQWSVDQSGLETDDVNRKRLHYLLGNHLGSVSLELDEAGDVITYEEYFPFGDTSFLAGPGAREVRLKDYRYSGKLRDDATGLYCYEYRYYAPFIGNWLSPDPIGPVDGLNLYCFVRNNPIRFVDVNGLQASQTLREVGQVPAGLSEEETIAAFNRQYAVQRGLRVTDIRKHGNDWLIINEKPLSAEFLELAKPDGDIDAAELYDFAELIESLRERAGEGPTGESPGEGGEHGAGDEPGTDNPHGEQADPPPDPTRSDIGGGSGGGTKATGPGTGTGTQGSSPGGSGTAATPGTSDGRTKGAGPGEGKDGGQGAGKSEISGRGAGKQGSERGSERGSEEGSERGVPGGQPGGTGTTAEAGQKGGMGTLPVPPGFPTGPDGVPYSPEMQPPEVTPEGGTPVTDPSQASHGSGSDPRGDPAADSGGDARPGGSEQGSPDGGPGQGTGADRGAGEAGQPDGGNGLKSGMGSHELPSWLSWIDEGLDYLQTGLDIVGLVPGLGELADGINGLISLARGDYAGAALSFAAMIPFAGWAATAGKFGRRAVEAAGVAGDVTAAVTKYGDEAASVTSTVARTSDEAAQIASKSADDLAAPVRPGPQGASLNSSNATAGVERASGGLLEKVGERRSVQIVKEGSEEARYLDAVGAEANVGGSNMDHILLRENPSKAAVLEEFLHGTQHKLGIIEELGRAGAERHVKEFMIRHSGLLKLDPEDVRRLRILMEAGL